MEVACPKCSGRGAAWMTVAADGNGRRAFPRILKCTWCLGAGRIDVDDYLSAADVSDDAAARMVALGVRAAVARGEVLTVGHLQALMRAVPSISEGRRLTAKNWNFAALYGGGPVRPVGGAPP